MADDKPRSTTATANVELRLGNHHLRTTVSVPAEPVRLVDLLPIVQRVADAIVDSAVEDVVAQGRSISCKKGCGKCCRQLVPISEVEARRIGELVEAMPEPRRTEIRARFVDAKARLAETGLLEKLLARAEWNEDQFIDIGTSYFHQGLACPFLEDESCSIHQDRPVTCREYLVTSPAANCACPTKDNIEKVGLPVQVWTALARFDETPGAKYCRWVPLVIAPEWAAENRDEPPPRPGPELLQEFFERLAGSPIKSAQA
jgi:Fe-S-cluster containining protein